MPVDVRYSLADKRPAMEMSIFYVSSSFVVSKATVLAGGGAEMFNASRASDSQIGWKKLKSKPSSMVCVHTSPSVHNANPKKVQPRLLFVLAGDGLVPKSLSKTDEQGVLRNATIVSGVTMVIVAAIAPFTGLDDFISAGILLGFAVTNSSAIMMRR